MRASQRLITQAHLAWGTKQSALPSELADARAFYTTKKLVTARVQLHYSETVDLTVPFG
jgi:hypothetical protein